ncbi:MAG: hypothetical protein FWD47_02450 [Treponema sp.]|nr:hypothetical protein [Treponema sp.]
MKKILLVLLFTLFYTLIYAQTNVTVTGVNGQNTFTFQMNTPDPAIRQLPREITSLRQNNTDEFIVQLVQYIKENATCDFDLVKKLHDWVALNISYDTQSYFSGRHASQSFNDVIRRGSGICAGYSQVLKYFCDLLEIECTIVEGYARGFGRSLFRTEDVNVSNHSWNIVTINGKRFLIDSTWNAGYIEGRTFNARYRTDYLFTDPSIFIYDHLPLNRSHQLLDPPLTSSEFESLPFLDMLFFQSVKTWTNLPRVSHIKINDTPEIDFVLNEGYEFGYQWIRLAGNTTTTISRTYPQLADTYRVNIPRFQSGSYILRIYIRKAGDSLYWSCGDFGFNVTR